MKLSTTLSHITTVPNSNNSKVISEFHRYMKSIGTSENYQNQNLKTIIGYAKRTSKQLLVMLSLLNRHLFSQSLMKRKVELG
jgi:hypothetical protein